MKSLLKVAEALDWAPRNLGKLAGWLILPLIAIIMFDVITRKIDYLRIGMSELSWYWLIEPIKLQDMEWHLHGVLLLMTFGFGYLLNAHVRVDIFREQLSRRGQAWVELGGLLFLAIPYLSLVLYFAFIFVKISILQGEGSESLTGIPMRYIVKCFTVVGFVLVLSAVLATFMRLIAYQFGAKEEKAEAESMLHVFAHEEEVILEKEAKKLIEETADYPDQER